MLAGSAVADVKDMALEKLKNEQNNFDPIA